MPCAGICAAVRAATGLSCENNANLYDNI